MLLAAARPASAQSVSVGTPRLTETPGFTTQGPTIFGVAQAAPSAPSASAGIACSEILPGNGTGAGYVLSHGGVLPETVSISAEGRHLTAGRDYFLNPADGTLLLAAPVSAFSSIDIYYRYVAEADTGRRSLAMPGLQLSFGGASTLGLYYGMSSAGSGTGLNVSTYGFNLNSAFGAGKLSSLTGLAYFSNVQRSLNLVLPTSGSPGGQPQPAASAPAVGADHLLVQDLSVRSHALTLHAGFQDVGLKFSGFEALKATAQENKPLQDQLTQLQAETGIKRLGFGLGYGLAPDGKGQHGLAMDWSRIDDGKGTIARESASLTAGLFHANFSQSDISRTFSKFSGLREADKAAWQHEAGMRISSMDVGLAFGAARPGHTPGGLDLLEQTFGDKTGTLQRDVWSLDTGPLALDLMSHRSAAGFARFADLADADKAALALDIRRMYDPQAKPEQVTQKEKDQLASSAGLNRSALRAQVNLGKRAGAITLSALKLSDGAVKQPGAKPGVQRSALAYTGKTLQVSYLRQRIADDFSRATQLSDFERQQLGNEHGLDREQLSLILQLDKLTKVGFSSLRVSPTQDSVAAAVRSALKNGADPRDVGRLVASHLSRETITLESRGMTFAYNLGDTDKGFTRAADLAIPDPEKGKIDAERGFRRADYTGHFALVKGLTLDTTSYRADNPFDKLAHDTFKHTLAYAPGKSLNLTYETDGDISRADSKQNGTLHDVLTLSQKLNRGLAVTVTSEHSTVMTAGAVSQRTNDTRVETPSSLPDYFSYDDRSVTYQNGQYEHALNLNFHAKPSKDFTIEYGRQAIDRDPKDPSAETDTFTFDWQATKQFAVVGGVAQTASTDKKNADTVSLGLQGQPVQNVTVAAKFDELHKNGVDTKDSADVAISNGKPFRFGPIQDLTITARYAALNDLRALQNETMTGRASWTLWKNQFLLDYGGLTKQDHTSTTARTYQFLTDPNAKKWFHAGFLYKDKTLIDGHHQLIRRFTTDARLTRHTSFAYTYGTLPEDEHGTVTPLESADVALKQALRPTLSGEWFYRLSHNSATKILTRSLGFGLEGKLSSTSTLQLAYSVDANGFADRYDHSDHIHFGFEQKLNSDHFLALTAELRSHDQRGLMDELQTNLEFRSRF